MKRLITLTKLELELIDDVFEDSMRVWEVFTRASDSPPAGSDNAIEIERLKGLFESAYAQAGEALKAGKFDVNNVCASAVEIIVQCLNGTCFLHQLDYAEDLDGYPLTASKKRSYKIAAARLETKFRMLGFAVTICR